MPLHQVRIPSRLACSPCSSLPFPWTPPTPVITSQITRDEVPVAAHKARVIVISLTMRMALRSSTMSTLTAEKPHHLLQVTPRADRYKSKQRGRGSPECELAWVSAAQPCSRNQLSRTHEVGLGVGTQQGASPRADVFPSGLTHASWLLRCSFERNTYSPAQVLFSGTLLSVCILLSAPPLEHCVQESRELVFPSPCPTSSA